jgi:manganese/zinc/iron transport system permease protein
MSFAISLFGVFLFVQRKSLISEVLSHAAYSGVALAFCFGFISLFTTVFFASIFSLLGLLLMELLQKKFRVKEDNALCSVLSLSFGVALLLISFIQTKNPMLYRESLFFLYGQVATLTDSSILPYAILSLLTVSFIILLYYPLKLFSFDQTFSKLKNSSYRIIQNLFLLIFVVVLTVTIKSVGVLLVTGLLLAPAIAARQYANRLSKILLLSSVFSLFGTFTGLVLSEKFEEIYQISLPPGPFIVCFLGLIAIFSLLFSSKRGVFFRLWRKWLFKQKIHEENLLKILYKKKCKEKVSLQGICAIYPIDKFQLSWTLYSLKKSGWIKKEKQNYFLTENGEKKAKNILRLHRLWEVYLVFIGEKKEKVHSNAEMMEHILTPEVEQELEKFLSYPKKDPHEQPIPKKEGDL